MKHQLLRFTFAIIISTTATFGPAQERSVPSGVDFLQDGQHYVIHFPTGENRFRIPPPAQKLTDKQSEIDGDQSTVQLSSRTDNLEVFTIVKHSGT